MKNSNISSDQSKIVGKHVAALRSIYTNITNYGNNIAKRKEEFGDPKKEKVLKNTMLELNTKLGIFKRSAEEFLSTLSKVLPAKATSNKPKPSSNNNDSFKSLVGDDAFNAYERGMGKQNSSQSYKSKPSSDNNYSIESLVGPDAMNAFKKGMGIKEQNASQSYFRNFYRMRLIQEGMISAIDNDNKDIIDDKEYNSKLAELSNRFKENNNYLRNLLWKGKDFPLEYKNKVENTRKNIEKNFNNISKDSNSSNADKIAKLDALNNNLRKLYEASYTSKKNNKSGK